MQKLLEYLTGLSKPVMISIAFALVIAIGLLDHFISIDFSFIIFYLVPIFLGAWFVGAWAGVALSLLSIVAWALADNIFFRPYSYSFAPYWNITVYLTSFLVATFYAKVLRNSLEQERQVSRSDFLTNAVSRRHFLELADAELNRARRYNHPFTAVYIDLDNFKQINDTFGHDVGDEVLMHVASTITDQIRTTDILARLGGDEFMIFFPETGAEMAMAAIDKVRKVLLLAMGKNNWSVTFSFGMVTFVTPPWSVDHMVKLTDDLMYEGKKSGKNTIKHDVYRG
jgi:diguanylate cyclase (GGDEF)-like protein